MAIPEEVINEIKYKNEIEDVISQYSALKRRGKNLVGLCPFHSEKTPSFTVYPESGSFYCFGCGVGGDVITFTSLIENLDYVEAIKLLAEKSNIALPQDGYDNTFQKVKNTVYDINRETAKFFHNYLMSDEGKWALDYYKNRGLSLKTIKHFGLGAAPDSWDALIKHLKAKGYTEGDMVTANVVNVSQGGKYYDRFRKRAMFPIINIRGNIVGFSGRAMPGEDKEGGKYVNTSDTPVYKKSENLFGINYAKNFCSEQMILVEGNMDVISLHQAGFENVVAPLGTAFTLEQANLIARYTKEIVLMLDADAAGQKAIKRAEEILRNTGLSVRVVSIPNGKDPDEFIKTQGPDRFKALLEGAVSNMEYKLLMAAQGLDLNNEDGKLKYLNLAAEIIATANDLMERDIYIGRLSDKYGVSRTALSTKVDELRQKNAREVKKAEINAIIHPKFSKDDVNPERRNSVRGTNAEETVISILWQHPDFYDEVKKNLTSDKMITSLNRRIYEIICEAYDDGRPLDISLFAQKLLPAEVSKLVMLQNADKGGNAPKAVLMDCIKVIFEEKERLTAPSADDVSTEDWAAQLQSLIDKKK